MTDSPDLNLARIAATLVDLMTDDVDSAPVSKAWNALRIALLPYRAALAPAPPPPPAEQSDGTRRPSGLPTDPPPRTLP